MRLQQNMKADLLADGPGFWQALGRGLTFLLCSENLLQLWEDVKPLHLTQQRAALQAPGHSNICRRDKMSLSSS